MRRIEMLGAVLLAAGCVTLENSRPAMRMRSAPHIGCGATETTVEDYRQDWVGGMHWTAKGCDRAAACSARIKDFQWGGSEHVDCQETAGSEARVAVAVVVDRLALETGCPAPQVKVLSSSGWSRGKEQAYRMEACGKAYVCTTAPGRTDCKLALDQTPAAKPD